MAWLRPYDFRDPGGGWSDEELAYDADVETRAKHVDFTTYPRAMSGWLELLFTRTVSSRLRVFWGDAGSTLMYWVDVYDGLTWAPIVVKQNFRGADWYETEFPAQAVTRVRIAWAHFGACSSAWGPAEVVIEGGCGGPLGDICGVFHSIGSFFDGLANDIAGIMFVGDALSAPFVPLGDTFHHPGDSCCQASGTLQDILDALEGGISWDEIEAFIRGLIPTLPDWLDDPLLWLTDMLEENFPLLYYLVVDPVGEILYLIGQAFDLEPYEARSGELIVKALFERYFPSLYLLWRDMDAGLWEWLVDRYEDAFESIQARLYVLAERTLRFFWEGEW